jgi:hypothetical protein
VSLTVVPWSAGTAPGVPQVQPVPTVNLTASSLVMQPVLNPSLSSTTYQGQDQYDLGGNPRPCGPNGLSVLDAPCTTSAPISGNQVGTGITGISGNQVVTGRDVDRDCGLSAKTTSGYDLWVCCDTAIFDKYGAAGYLSKAVETFTHSSTTAVEPANEFFSGYAPILAEQTGANSLNGESNSPFQFLPNNQSPWVTQNEQGNAHAFTACPRWPNGEVALPSGAFGNIDGTDTGDLVLTFYQEWCYNSWPPSVSGGRLTTGGVAWSMVDPCLSA